MTYTEITPELTRSDDLAVGVHCRGRAGATEGAEIDHPACRRPGEGMGTACDGAPADDLASIVQCESYALSENAQPPEGAEIDHPAGRRPGEGMIRNTKSDNTFDDDLAVGVDCQGIAPRAAERAEIDHPAGRRPGEGKTLATGLAAPADNLATVVHGQGPAVSATGEAAEIHHPACRRPGEGSTINTKSVTHADDLAFGLDLP